MKILSAIVGATTLLTAHADVLAGPVTNSVNGHLYYLLTTNTWTGAEAEAVSLGGHLVTINDTNENHWVCTNFLLYAGAARTLWIGLFQPSGSVEPAGGWRWASGESVTFTNWIPGEPNNNSSQGPQNWAMIWPPTAASVSPYAPEKWNDTWNLPNTGVGSQYLYGLHGVVEVVPPAGSSGTPTNSSIHVEVEIGWPSQAGKYYQVQWSVSLKCWRHLQLRVRHSGEGEIQHRLLYRQQSEVQSLLRFGAVFCVQALLFTGLSVLQVIHSSPLIEVESLFLHNITLRMCRAWCNALAASVCVLTG